MATTFIESGSAATQDMSFYQLNQSAGTGSVTSSTQAVLASLRSIAVATGASNGSGGVYSPNVLADAGSRITFGFRFSGSPSPSGGAGSTFLTIDNFGTSSISFCFGLTGAGKIVLMNGTGTQLAIGTTVLTQNNDYRISLAYVVTSASVNTITLYINGVSEIAVTNVTVSTTGTSAYGFDVGDTGWTAGSNLTCFYAHIFVDNGTSGDVGNILVTAKRPFANGTTNGFSTSGAGSGYGTGHAPFVNYRPLQTATANVNVTVVASAITEEFNIEGIAVGDVNITGATIKDFTGWLYCKSTLSETDSIRLVGNNSNIAVTSTATLFTKIAGSTTYPPGTGTDIGMVTNTTAATATLYDAGIIVAYTPGPPIFSLGYKRLLGVGL